MKSRKNIVLATYMPSKEFAAFINELDQDPDKLKKFIELEDLLGNNTFKIQSILAYESTSSRTLAVLSESKNNGIREMVASNKSLSFKTFCQLAEDRSNSMI